MTKKTKKKSLQKKENRTKAISFIFVFFLFLFLTGFNASARSAETSGNNFFLETLRQTLRNGKIEAVPFEEKFQATTFPKKFYGIALILYQPKDPRIVVVRRGKDLEILKTVVRQMMIHPRFKKFDLENPQKSRIQLDFILSEMSPPFSFEQLNPYEINSERFEIGVDGLRMSDGVKTRYLLPGDAFVFSLMSLGQLQRHIQRNFGVKSLQKIRLQRFISKSYVSFSKAHEKETWVELYRGYPVLGPMKPSQLESAARTGVDYLIQHQKPNGQFLYYYDAARDSFRDHEHPKRDPIKDPYYNELRHAGGALLLLHDYRISKNEKLLAPVRLAIDFLLKLAVPYKLPGGQEAAYFYYNKKSKLGGSGIGLYLLAEYQRLTADQRYEKDAHLIARHLLSQITATGEFLYYYIYLDERVKESDNQKYFSFYYPGEALIGLAAYYKTIAKEDDKAILRQKMESALHFLLEVRPQTHARYYQPLPSDSWLMMAIHELWDIPEMQKDSYKEFVYSDAEKMIHHMYTEENALYPDYPGAFYYRYGDPPYADGARAEGLLAAYELAVKVKDQREADLFLSALKLAARATLRLCNTKESVYSLSRPEKAIGGIRFKYTRQWFRVDTIQHVASFYLKFLPYWG